ncbi:glycosyltransferase [Streptosporangium sp. LJ11]|uniref:glycosyltransferase n=1 Tax=Streptosporangium sp. LJ11 TaxID=3436927 RepID=UPI003F7B11CC
MVPSWSLVVPARDSERDIKHVVRCGRKAGARQIVVVENGSGDATASRAREAGATVITSTPGKGRAVKAGLRYVERFGHDAVVTSDADLWALDSDLLKRTAEAAAVTPVRGEWDRPGRAGALLLPLMEESGIDTGGVSPAALLSGLAGYPMPFPLPLDTLPDDYGWDLATALDLLAAGRPIRTVPAGPRLHRPGDESRISTIMIDLAQVCVARSRLGDQILD